MTSAGAAIALVREGGWGLSRLIVRPGLQSAGLGRALLQRALAHGHGARGGIILPSGDARGLRVDAAAGFALLPTVKPVATRLELRPQSAVCLRGEDGPFTPYLPGGAYLQAAR